MSSELVYTSAPTGLKPGSKGFCTVAVTAGLSTAWVDRLESLSPYRALYPLGDPKSDHNPINFSHWRVTVAGKTRSVLSRVAFDGADYSGRSNKLAHHIVLETTEQPDGGPAWMLLQPGLMRTKWSGAAHQIPAGPKLPSGNTPPRPCTAWATATGDAGWAGALAKSFMTEPAKPAYLIYTPGTDVLKLFEESLSLLPPAKRWEVTFSTFFTDLPLNLNCSWRAVVAGTPAALEAFHLGPRALLINVTKSDVAMADSMADSSFAEAARTGSGPFVEESELAVSVLATSKSNRSKVSTETDQTQRELVMDVESRPVIAIGVKTKKTLGTVPAAYELEEEIGYGEVDDLPQRLDRNGQLSKKGVATWLFAISVILCLGLSGVIFSALWQKMRQQRAQLGAEITKLDGDLAYCIAAKTSAEKQALDASRQLEHATFRLTQEKASHKKDVVEGQIKFEEIDGRLQALESSVLVASSQKSQSQESPAYNPAHPAMAEQWQPVPEIPYYEAKIESTLDHGFSSGMMALPGYHAKGAYFVIRFPNGSTTKYQFKGKNGDAIMSAERRVDGHGVALRISIASTDSLGTSSKHYIYFTLNGTQVDVGLISSEKNSANFATKENQALASEDDSQLRRCTFAVHDKDDAILGIYSYRPEKTTNVKVDTDTTDASWPADAKFVSSPQIEGWKTTGMTENGHLVNFVFEKDESIAFDARVAEKRLSFTWVKQRKPTLALFTNLSKLCQRFEKRDDNGAFTAASNLSAEDVKICDRLPQLKQDAANVVSYLKMSDDDRKPHKLEFENLKIKVASDWAEIDRLLVHAQNSLECWSFREFNLGVALPNGFEVARIIVQSPDRKP